MTPQLREKFLLLSSFQDPFKKVCLFNLWPKVGESFDCIPLLLIALLYLTDAEKAASGCRHGESEIVWLTFPTRSRWYPLQTKQTLLYHLKPNNCEWLQRPNVAINELAETITENLGNLMERYRGFLLQDEYLDQLQSFYAPIMDNLNKLHSKNEDSVADEEDWRTFCKQ